MKTGRYSLKELLTHNEIEQIIIPEIQRDYVWEITNVSKLIDDINRSYKKKISQQFEIKINGVIEINITVNQFLIKEYERLKFHQKLGFIYAYHDRDYAGKFFLIDGQQRLTTLFLILLCLYKELGKADTFRTLYFNNKIPKVNYKVREQSNDFMQLMIESELTGKAYEESEKFYKSDYLKDVTISHLIANYDHIKSHIGKIENKEGFLEYLEDFVEVNYFDTHLSEQGEQLYIYMNSRGEQLSFQEIVRAELMQKIIDPAKKIELGNEWEKWQNFFWTKRGENENADKGFEEFLKWAAIIHMGLNNEVDLENFIDSKKTVTQKQLKENYIKEFKNDTSDKRNQNEALFKYQVKYFDFEFLKNIFDAVLFIYTNQTQYIPVKVDWLSGKINIIDYVLLAPLIQYVVQNVWLDKEEKIVDIERIAMFLKNISYFEGVSKNPDSATLDSIFIISQLNESKKSIIHLKDLSNYSKTIVTNAEIFKIDLYKNGDTHRRNWEEFIWEITLDHDFNTFLMGDISILFKCLELEKSSDIYINELHTINNYKYILKNIVFKNKQSDKLRRLMLTKFDYLIKSGSGGGIAKYSFIGNVSSWETWREWKETFLKNEFAELLLWIKVSDNKSIDELLKEGKNTFTSIDFRQAFIFEPTLLKYCKDKKILWQDESKILLLEKTNYSIPNSKEIQCALLENSFKNDGMWVQENNCCVVDFSHEESEFKSRNKGFKGYALNIVFNPANFNWSFTLFHRENNIHDLIDISKDPIWQTKDDRITFKEKILFNINKEKSLIENNNKVKMEVDNLIISIKELFNKALI